MTQTCMLINFLANSKAQVFPGYFLIKTERLGELCVKPHGVLGKFGHVSTRRGFFWQNWIKMSWEREDIKRDIKQANLTKERKKIPFECNFFVSSIFLKEQDKTIFENLTEQLLIYSLQIYFFSFNWMSVKS